MENAEKTVLDDSSNAQEIVEITTINEADLSEIKALLEKQVEYQELEQQEKLEQQKLLEEEQKLMQEEEQLLEEEELKQEETVNSMSENIQLTATTLEESNTQLTEIIGQLNTMLENQNKQQEIIVEGGWLITLSIALAVGLRIFWDHVLKW